MANREYGSRFVIEVEIYNGEVRSIDWDDIAVGTAAGLGAAVAWQLFGGEILCFVGFAPMCACVGPQC